MYTQYVQLHQLHHTANKSNACLIEDRTINVSHTHVHTHRQTQAPTHRHTHIYTNTCAHTHTMWTLPCTCMQWSSLRSRQNLGNHEVACLRLWCLFVIFLFSHSSSHTPCTVNGVPSSVMASPSICPYPHCVIETRVNGNSAINSIMCTTEPVSLSTQCQQRTV